MTAATIPRMEQDARLEQLVKAQAYGLGFDLAGIAELGPAETAAAFDEWIARGYAGEMSYMARTSEKRRDSRRAIDGATHAIVVAMGYGGAEPSGPVARYARGDDYHDVMLDRLRTLHAWIESHVGHAVRGKAYVDTGPLLERDLARRAGLGWFGKNTMLINPRVGSFFFLGALLVELELEPDAPFAADHCGTCRRCLDACPTGALVDAHVLDATRCVSYLTIELKGGIPEELRPRIGELLYGCDVCQEVCPWNQKFATELKEDAFRPRAAIAGKEARTLARELLEMSQEEFSRGFKGSPMKRAKLRGLKRNAAVALGNGAADVYLSAMSPTVLRDGPFRLFFFSREEERMHIHVAHPDGEAKFWLDPMIEIAVVIGLSARQVAEADSVVRRHEEEIRHAWTRHFGR